MTIPIHSPDELIAAVPHLLGFKPSESVVFVSLRADLPSTRVDLSTTVTDRDLAWNSFGDIFSHHAQPGASLALVCLTSNRAPAEAVIPEFAARIARIGIATPVKLWADDSRWYDLHSGESGIQTDAARNHIAASTVLEGHARPATSRDALAASLVGDRDPIAVLLPQTQTTARTPGADFDWAVSRIKQFQADSVRLTDTDATRLLVAVESIPIRDRLCEDLTRGTAATHVALWRDLTRRAPDEVRAAPASILGLASWLSGNGAMAWCALDQVPPDKSCALADLVEAVIQTGMHPREWECAKSRSMEHRMEQASSLVLLRQRAPHGAIQPAPGI